MNAGRPLVVLLDDDAQHEAQAIAERLKAVRQATGDEAQVHCVAPPGKKKDIAECGFQAIWGWIAKATGGMAGELIKAATACPTTWTYPAVVESHACSNSSVSA